MSGQKRRGLRPRFLLGALALCAVVGASFAVLLLAVRELRDESDRARHSAQVLAAANHLERLTLDLETGQRGFALTRQERFLEPWRTAIVAAPHEASALDQLVADNSPQERRARGIHRAISSYIDDYSRPLVAIARSSNASARAVIASGEGKRRVDAIRRQFDAFTRTERALSERRRADAAAAARHAAVAAAIGSGALLILIAAFVAYLLRRVATPMRTVAEASAQLAAGDYGARVPAGGVGEVRQLGTSFNEMASSLEQARDELESQNAELELQTAELEDQQALLAEANDELVAQRSELERALAELDEERRLIRMFYEFGERIAGKTDAAALADTILDGLRRVAAADAATLHAVTSDSRRHELVAARGIDAREVPPEVAERVGFAGRALVDRNAFVRESADASIRIPGLAGAVPVRHELYLPLVHGSGVVGVATFGRVADRPWTDSEIEALEHLAAQAAVAWQTAASFAREHRVSTINSAVLAATRDAITLAGTDGRIILRNPAAQRALGVYRSGGDTFEEAAESLAARVVDRAAYRAWVEDAIADPLYEGVHDFVLADSGRSFHMFTTPIRDGESTLGRVYVSRETTAEREADRLKTELVSTVSHELRTPLASILGFAELLLARDPEPDTRRQYLETIYREGRRLTDLVNHFLDLQRIESDGFALDVADVDVGDVVRDAVDVFCAQSDRHELELAVDAVQPLEVPGDRERIAQVVSNLLSNAIKYSPAGGPVEVAVARRNGAVRVAVRDTGVGIPSDQQQDVFKKFFRADSSDTRSIGGTGLGLALSRQIVEAHGGQIGFESVEGLGSTFWFELPADAR